MAANLDLSPVYVGGWEDNFFWIDWACIDQDDPKLKWRQVQALPLYMRCCNYFIGLCWGAYFDRAWCRLELKGFRRDALRLLVPPDGSPARRVAFADVDALTGGAPEDGKCHGEDRALILATMAALARVDDSFLIAESATATVPTAESAELEQLQRAAVDGDVEKVRALVHEVLIPAGISIDACPVCSDGKPLG